MPYGLVRNSGARSLLRGMLTHFHNLSLPPARRPRTRAGAAPERHARRREPARRAALRVPGGPLPTAPSWGGLPGSRHCAAVSSARLIGSARAAKVMLSSSAGRQGGEHSSHADQHLKPGAAMGSLQPACRRAVLGDEVDVPHDHPAEAQLPAATEGRWCPPVGEDQLPGTVRNGVVR